MVGREASAPDEARREHIVNPEARPVRWGIIGTGNIAHAFARGLAAAPGAAAAAVASRNRERGSAFAAELSIPRVYDSLEKLAADPDIDVVYVATPHALHPAAAELCLDAGKHVLCEKPLAPTAELARRVVSRARERGLFLMEAMWSFTFPAMAKALQLLSEGAIGRARVVSAQLGFSAAREPGSRLFAPDLGGGALLDVGVYGIALALRIAGGRPDEVQASSRIGDHAVDETTLATLSWTDGVRASVLCSIEAQLSGSAWIGGTAGAIEIPAKFSQPDRIILRRQGRDPEEFAFARIGNGYSFEAIEVMRCLASGLTESGCVPLDRSLEALEVCDAIRAKIGLSYPFEARGSAAARRDANEEPSWNT